jgi:hypothetical protein
MQKYKNPINQLV